MTNEEILKKAIEKAVENGWSDPTEKGFSEEWKKLKNMDNIKTYFVESIYKNLKWVALIFSHPFAKAFWKYERCGCEGDKDGMCLFIGKVWQYHLQQMVLCEDPITYLKKFI